MRYREDLNTSTPTEFLSYLRWENEQWKENDCPFPEVNCFSCIAENGAIKAGSFPSTGGNIFIDV